MTVNPNDAWRPTYQQQGPACHCQIDGKCLGWLSCTAYAMAMLIDRATLGKKRPSGCAVRRYTGDTTGGLSLPQVSTVAELQFGVDIDLYVGSNVIGYLPAYARLRAGRAFLAQGNTGPLVGTTYQSTAGGVNHAVTVIDGRDWDEDGRPDEVLVYDPAADGRHSWTDQGPTWWPRGIFERYCAALRPWGEADSRTLGSNRIYAGFARDTERHDHFRFGGKRTSPFPDRTRADRPGKRVNVYAVPDHLTHDPIRTIAHGELFVAFQVTTSGSSYAGSRTWLGNHDGTEWVHSKRLSHRGGST